MSDKRILYFFTRTPLHVGAGSSVGAIDQPIIRERHTGFPVIPATSLKGTFADAWNSDLKSQGEKRNLRVTTKKVQDNEELDEVTDAAWLFGSDNATHAFAGALQFSEARLLAFPIRSAKGSFAWITCPLMLERAARDGVLDRSLIPKFPTEDQAGKSDELAFFGANGPLALGDKVVLEEYTFSHTGSDEANKVGKVIANLLDDDGVWNEVALRLVILSNGMMSFFAQNACEVAQHVRINDETGTAAGSALFNQENVPSETMFYSVLRAFDERSAKKDTKDPRKAGQAFGAFEKKCDGQVYQFGGDASTGLGYCTVRVNGEKRA